MPDLTAASWSDLRESAAAIEREVARRESLDEAARAEQFSAELAEVRNGTRALQDEHLAYLTPREVTDAVNRGQVRGIAPDKRLRRGR